MSDSQIPDGSSVQFDRSAWTGSTSTKPDREYEQAGTLDAISRSSGPSDESPIGTAKKPLRVFISHGLKTGEEVKWLKSLVRYLEGQGIEARLDKLHLRHGMDFTQWMCTEIVSCSVSAKVAQRLS